VHHAPGVSSVIDSGARWPTIPEDTIDDLRRYFGENELRVLTGKPDVGEPVQIASGVLCGMQAVVTQVMPARNRVSALLEFLGRQTTVKLPLDQVMSERNEQS